MIRSEIDLTAQLAAFDGLTAPQLRKKYGEIFNETTNSNNKEYLRRRIAWRLQELQYGGLSWRAQARAEELAADTSLRHRLPSIADTVQQPEGYIKNDKIADKFDAWHDTNSQL